MAIKVNGTTVINDSRALSNIASVDATTAAAIGAAGVGGSTTLLTENASLSGLQVEISFTGNYKYYNIMLSGMKSVNYADLYARLTNSSGTAITGYDYWFAFNAPASQGIFGYPYMNFSANSFYRDGGFGNLFLTVQNPNSSTSMTSWSFDYGSYTPDEQGKITYGAGHMETEAVNNSIQFYTNNNNFTGGTYSVWGVS